MPARTVRTGQCRGWLGSWKSSTSCSRSCSSRSLGSPRCACLRGRCTARGCGERRGIDRRPGTAWLQGQARRPREAAGHCATARGAAEQEGCAGRAVERLHLVLGLRHRRDADLPAARVRARRLPRPAADDLHRAGRPADHDRAVSPGRHDLHAGGRVLRRRARELRPARRPDRVGRAAHRLHRHRCRAVGSGDGRDHLAGTCAAALCVERGDHRRRRADPRLRQPARGT